MLWFRQLLVTLWKKVFKKWGALPIKLGTDFWVLPNMLLRREMFSRLPRRLYLKHFNPTRLLLSQRNAWFLSVLSCANRIKKDGVALYHLDGSSVKKGIDKNRCSYARKKDWLDWKVHSSDQYFHTKIIYSWKISH